MSTLFDIAPEALEDAADLPPLRGTDRQLPWARDVRKRLLAECDRLLREWERLVETLARTGKTAAAERERVARRRAYDALEGVRAQTSAHWWIARRSQSARELLAGTEPPDDGWRR